MLSMPRFFNLTQLNVPFSRWVLDDAENTSSPAVAAVAGQPTMIAQAVAFVATYPIIFTIIALYLAWRRLTEEAHTRAGPWGPRWLARLVGMFLTRLYSGSHGFGLPFLPGWVTDWLCCVPVKRVRLPRTRIDRKQQHVVVWHPHGAYASTAAMHCGHLSMQQQPLEWYPGIAPVLFNVPFFREAMLLLNARSVDARVIDRLADAGLNVAIQPGGIPEQIRADHTKEIAVFSERMGFVRLAMRRGAPLLPVYVFGENQTFTTSRIGRAFANLAFRYLGVPLPLTQGSFGLPWLIPRHTEVSVCWGEPVDVGAPNTTPTDAQVQQVFERYVVALRKVFDENKDACLPAEVAAKGLEVIVRSGRNKAVRQQE